MKVSLWHHRELIWQLTVREVQQRYRGSYLGMLWTFAVPLLMLAIYTFVFSVVFNGQWGLDPANHRPGAFALILFAGLIPFNLFADVMNRAPATILSVPNYVKKVVFPLEVLPVVIVFAAAIHSFISVGVFLLGNYLILGTFPFSIIWLPLAYIPLVLLCLCLSWFLSALGVYIRDVGQGIGIVVQILFFISPVFYPVEAVPGSIRFLLLINPLTTILSCFRRALVWQTDLQWGPWAGWVVLSALLAGISYIWFMRTKSGFADVL